VRGPLRRVLVRGPSMAPTLADGDVVLVAPGLSPRPGDVVLVRWASRPDQLSVKRAVRPEGSAWHVLGDFPDASTDSRTLGPVAVEAVVIGRLSPRPGRLPRGGTCHTGRSSAGPTVLRRALADGTGADRPAVRSPLILLPGRRAHSRRHRCPNHRTFNHGTSNHRTSNHRTSNHGTQRGAR